MSVRIVKDPLLTTVQDLGRRGYQKLGVNPNGAMDRTAARVANILCGNDVNAAVLEMHFPAGEIEFGSETLFCLTGADLGAELDGEPIETCCTYAAKRGSVLLFTGKKSGSRSYIAVAGGFDVETWLNSRSTNLAAQIGGFEGRRVSAGDVIEIGTAPTTGRIGLRCSRSIIPIYSRFPTVRVIAGPEFGWLTYDAKTAFANSSFSVSPESNRMGFRLQGPPMGKDVGVEMISSPVCFGTVQLLPDGQLIVLMADHGTAGGYPRVASVVSVDLPLVAQLDAGDKIGFQIISTEEAEQLNLELESDFCLLKAGVGFGI